MARGHFASRFTTYIKKMSYPTSPVYDWLDIPTKHKRSVYFDHEKFHIVLTDQPALPDTFRRHTCPSVEATAFAINTMIVRGAPAIGVTGAYGMVLAASESSSMADLLKHKATLDAARPTAVNLTWATSRMLDFVSNILATSKTSKTSKTTPTIKSLVPILLDQAEQLADEDIAINLRMAKVGSTIVPTFQHRATNISHRCNTGALAATDWGTALGVIHYCHKILHRNIHVWVDETRPRLQGARLSAWELTKANIPMHLISDGVAGGLMRKGQIDVVLFGADRVAKNGDVVNKIGTFPLAVMAHTHGIPVYAVVPTSTIDLTCITGDDVEIEERNSNEVIGLSFFNQGSIAPTNVQVYNPAFDNTPYKYLTGIITEEGLCYPPFTESLLEAKNKAEERIQSKNGKFIRSRN